MRISAVFFLISFATFAAASTQTGEINGAQFRIDIPENWNGGLVMYCHGYSPVPVTFKEFGPHQQEFINEFLRRGFAIAQSGYSTGGWAIQEAAVDTESLRRYFIAKHGALKETWITGHSMGGFLTMMLMETYATVYKGGLPLCGPLASASWFLNRGAFDARVVFDYLFPGLLPDRAKGVEPEDTRAALADKILAALETAPAKADGFRRMFGIKTDKEIAQIVGLLSGLLHELERRAGGSPFDNLNVIYTGSSDDNALNDGVKRYAADPKAAAYLRAFYTPTGKIVRPILAIHTVYDPLVPPSIPNTYQNIAGEAGNHDLFVQQFVKHDGHCAITPAETGRGFDELREWAASGRRPSGGDRTIAAAPSGSR